MIKLLFFIYGSLLLVNGKEESTCISQKEHDDIKKKVKAFETKEKHWIDTEEKMKRELDQLNKEKDSLSEQFSTSSRSYDKEMKKLQQSLKENSDAKSELKGCGKENQAMSKNIEDLDAQIKQLKRDLQVATKNYQTCSKDLHAAGEKKDSTADLKQRIADLEKQLKEAGLIEWLSVKFDEGSTYCKANFDEHYPKLQAHANQFQTFAGQQFSKLQNVASKLYEEHAKETLQPLVSAVDNQTSPWIKKYKPIIMKQWNSISKQVKKITVQWFTKAKLQFYSARENIITLLLQKPAIAPYAQLCTDLLFLLLLTPFALIFLMMSWRLVWFLLYLPFLLCCCCCRKRSKVRRNSKPKSKSRRKQK